MASDVRGTVLITATGLAERLGSAAPPVILAVRNAGPAALGGFRDTPRIPGAVDIDLATHLAGPGGGMRGSRPLPELAALQRALRSWGIGQHSQVVLYDHDRNLTAARGWWVLRWAGLAEVRLLDGGFAAWLAAAQPLSHAPPQPTPGDVVVSGGGMAVLSADAAAVLARRSILLDTRIRANYIGGATAPGEAPRGHIPGAISAPAADNLTEAGTFADAATLRHLYAALGVDGTREVGISCGAGVSAAHAVAALASIGIEAAMYPGSWSAWSADPQRPVVVGGAPG